MAKEEALKIYRKFPVKYEGPFLANTLTLILYSEILKLQKDSPLLQELRRKLPILKLRRIHLLFCLNLSYNKSLKLKSRNSFHCSKRKLI